MHHAQAVEMTADRVAHGEQGSPIWGANQLAVDEIKFMKRWLAPGNQFSGDA